MERVTQEEGMMESPFSMRVLQSSHLLKAEPFPYYDENQGITQNNQLHSLTLSPAYLQSHAFTVANSGSPLFFIQTDM